MTSPFPAAPYGYLQDGVPSQSIEDTRDSMLREFMTQTDLLRANRDYYEAERRPEAIGISVPPEMRKLLSHVGYPRLYVDSVAERQELEGFRLGGADSADDQLWDWWQANDLDVDSPLGHTDALVHGRAYITVAAPSEQEPGVDPDVPVIRVEPPTTLFATIDPRTRKVLQAFRGIWGLHHTLQQNVIVAATLYLPNLTQPWVKPINDGTWHPLETIEHGLGMVPVVPIPNRTRLSDLLGTSEITPELRSVTDAAARIMMDMQATAEVMAIPQRLLFGVTNEQLGVDPATGQSSYDAYMARILAFADPEGKAQQFAAAELRNYVEALDALDRKVAMYTGLPPQYLSFTAMNPPSAEAIQAAEARLVKRVERKNVLFGGAWEQAMRIAKKVMSGSVPDNFYRMEAIWRDPSTPTYAAKADAATKLYANGTGVIPKKRARLDMGYSIAEIEDMEQWDKDESQMTLLGAIAAGQLPPPTGGAAGASGPAGAATGPQETVTESETQTKSGNSPRVRVQTVIPVKPSSM